MAQAPVQELKVYCVVFVPHHRSSKEWVNVQAVSKAEAIKNFKGGLLLKIDETDDEYDEEEGM
jgi:hypothetical protein